MDGFGYACAVVLAAVLVWAAVAKLGRPGGTAAGFTALKLPTPALLAWLVPLVELSVAVALLAAPPAGGVAALVLLVLFSAVIARALHAGVEAPCGCFGARASEPVAARDLARNAGLVLLAVGAVTAPRPEMPDATAVALVVALTAMAAVCLRATHTRARSSPSP